MTTPQTSVETPLDFAVIGCGAVAQGVHLPALEASPHRIRFVVDPALDRARALADQYGATALESLERLPDGVDAALIGTPHQFHAPAAIQLMNRGIHVLVEKPMALTTHDCDQMIAAAAASHVVLVVGLLRRFTDSLRYVKALLDADVLGAVESFSLSEGGVYRWKVAGDSTFKPGSGGVLADAGAHVLDLVLWWLGECTHLAYEDDSNGGVDAECRVHMTMANGAVGTVELSRIRNLSNLCTIRGTRATVHVGTKTKSSVTLVPAGCDELSLVGTPVSAGSAPPASVVDLFSRQLSDFTSAIHGGTPTVSGKEGRRSVALIEECARVRRTLQYEWEPALVPVEVAR